LLLGEIGRGLVLLGQRARDFANPEDVADPKVAFRRLRGGKVRRDGAARGDNNSEARRTAGTDFMDFSTTPNEGFLLRVTEPAGRRFPG
jgi:hypothetical protein